MSIWYGLTNENVAFSMIKLCFTWSVNKNRSLNRSLNEVNFKRKIWHFIFFWFLILHFRSLEIWLDWVWNWVLFFFLVENWLTYNQQNRFEWTCSDQSFNKEQKKNIKKQLKTSVMNLVFGEFCKSGSQLSKCT